MSPRTYGTIVSVVTMAALLSPLVRDGDSFPLSSFPMFSKRKPPQAVISHVVAVRSDGTSWPIDPALVAKGEVLQTKVAISRAIMRREAPKLCAEVAARISGEDDYADASSVEVRSDTYQVAGYFSSTRQPIRSHLHARCEVPGL